MFVYIDTYISLYINAIYMYFFVWLLSGVCVRVMPFWMGWIVTTPQPQRPEPGKVVFLLRNSAYSDDDDVRQMDATNDRNLIPTPVANWFIRPKLHRGPAIPFFDFTVFIRAADTFSMSGGRNAVKCKANTKYGHLSSKGAAGYFLPSVRLNPIGWPTLRACGTLIDSAAIAW